MSYLIPANKLYFFKDRLLLYFKNNNRDFVFFSTPFFMFKEDKKFNFLFSNKFDYSKFLSNLKNLLKINLNIFFIKFKLKGLGYRFKKFSKYLYRFYFTRTSYIYFHKPDNVLVKHRKKRVILLSFNKQVLNDIFIHILNLHKVGPYNRRGFVYPRNIIVKKPGKKVT
jgi:hypothetical protein